MKRILREPLTHFLFLGLLLFAADHFWGPNRPGITVPRSEIRVTRAQASHLVAAFELAWQRPPTAGELSELLEDFIAEEVYYREGLRLELDRDDAIVRQRLRQKVEFLSADLVAIPEPDEADLQSYLAAHPELFRIEPRYTLSQVFLNPRQRGDSLERDAARLLAELNATKPVADLKKLGDPSLLDTQLEDYSESDVARFLGKEFARQLTTLTPGAWVGPVKSGYGAHLVRLDQRTPGRPSELDNVRQAVAEAWSAEQRRLANAAFSQSLRKQYSIVIDPGATNLAAILEAGQESPP